MNLYFQDEARFGLKTQVGTVITAKSVAPKVKFQHKFKNTYLYGAYSPINGDSIVLEVENVNKEIFHNYLKQLSEHKPCELKIVVIDNAGFHSTKDMLIPDNIKLLRIPPYTPELNPCEQVWAYIKKRFKNKTYENLEDLKDWLKQFVESMSQETIKSIVGNHHYLNAFYTK
ncbi:IS630 family transposase [Aquimarina sp. ERC-38]|nr:IS630 family transposase [Aquimarina sp. ERC-38]